MLGMIQLGSLHQKSVDTILTVTYDDVQKKKVVEISALLILQLCFTEGH